MRHPFLSVGRSTRGFTGVVALTLALAPVADARLIGTTITIDGEQHPNGVTYQLFLIFDDPLDNILAITGDADVLPLVFETDGAALLQNCVLSDSILCDVSGPLDLGGDSWVNVGTHTGCTDFSPNFLGGDGTESVIKGNFFSQSDNGAYFDAEPGTPVLPDEKGRVLIAQFSLPAGTCFSYRGTVNYVPGADAGAPNGFVSEPWVIGRDCPADLDLSGDVGFDDVLAMLSRWGPYDPCPPYQPADLDADCVVGFTDLLAVLSAWGPCARTGACCFETGVCEESTLIACIEKDGFYQGAGTTCDDSCVAGACCFDDGTCVEQINDLCIRADGSYRGDGTTCDDACAAGACCLDDGACTLSIESVCAANDGLYRGDGTSCEDSCGVGACCFDDGTCAELLEEVCADVHGFFRGNGTICADACPRPADACDDAPPLADGTHYYSTLDATSAAPFTLPPECDEGNGVGFFNDVWAAYTASCDGQAVANVCDSEFDTRVAIYETDACPGAIVACNDDACGNYGTRSEVTWPVRAGATYLIRIGGGMPVQRGTGLLSIECVPGQ